MSQAIFHDCPSFNKLQDVRQITMILSIQLAGQAFQSDIFVRLIARITFRNNHWQDANATTTYK